jgi:Zn finger protein HypA/HybF involved in hydrogenase expression
MAQKAAAKRVAAHEVAVKESTVTRQAQQLAAMQAKGVKSVEVGKGQRVALTAENISMILARTAKRQGMGEEQFAKLIGQIDASLKNLKITVKPADGLDKIKVETDRGPKQ